MMDASNRLSNGTQELPLSDAYSVSCRCGATLTWIFDTEDRYKATAQCDKCPMVYYASDAVIKIEGIDRSAL